MLATAGSVSVIIPVIIFHPLKKKKQLPFAMQMIECGLSPAGLAISY